MGQSGTALCSFSLAIVLICATVVDAGFILNSGTLHASATAFGTTGSVTSTPPDKTVDNPFFNSHSATATASGTSGTVTSSTSTRFGFLEVTQIAFSISGSTSLNNGSTFSGGTVTLTLPGTLVLDTTFEFTGIHGGAQVNIKNAADQTIFSQSKVSPNDPLPPPSTVNFSPGVYTLTWSVSGFPATGTGGSTSWRFQAVPEPASLALLGLPLAFLLRRPARR